MPWHVALLQLMVVLGATVSIWIGWVLTASTLPALSMEENFTDAVWDTVKGAEYLMAVMLVVGSEPSVV